MKTISGAGLLLLANLLMSSVASAKNIVPVPITKRDPNRTGIAKRSQKGTLINEKTLYAAQISVGTPGQSLLADIDTGSGDLWIFDVNTPRCQSGGCFGGTFDPSKSSTFVDVQKGGFLIEYVTSNITGDWITDNFALAGGSTIKAQSMGLARNTDIQIGVMGISYGMDPAHPDIVSQMVSQGLINSRAYGLSLGDLEASTGEILFGGIDTQKFVGSLQTLQLPQDVGAFQVPLSWLSLDGFLLGSQAIIMNNSTTTDVFLDSGSSYIYLPDAIVARIVSQLKAVDDHASSGNMYVDCNLRCSEPDAFFSFGLGASNSGSGPGPVIRVSISELILDLGLSSPYFKSTCLLAVFPSSSTGGYNILGDTFLRSAYVVYDLDNRQVAVAQANFAQTGSKVVEITKGALPLPLGVQNGNTKPPLPSQCSTVSPSSTFTTVIKSTTTTSTTST